jgi:archaeosine-15-forming tRNA-guanine transglycosylase
MVGPSELLPALRERAGAVNGDLLTFTDADALNALLTIVKRRPRLVALERMFALTPRGAALIHRIKADPKLRDAEIRVMAHNSDYSRVIPRTAPPASPPADQRGTRRAQRFRMTDNVTVVLDGKSGVVVDLSTHGAQVVSPGGLKPNQRVAVALMDHTSHVKFSASVAWTSFEMSSAGAPRYRAGINFEDADPAAVEAFCVRHRA